MQIVSDDSVQELVDKGEAIKVTYADGYVVLQQFDNVLFLLLIKFKNLDFCKMLNQIVHIAEARGCTKIQGIGRKGWLRKLRPFGFIQLPDTTLELSLGENNGRKI